VRVSSPHRSDPVREGANVEVQGGAVVPCVRRVGVEVGEGGAEVRGRGCDCGVDETHHDKTDRVEEHSEEKHALLEGEKG